MDALKLDWTLTPAAADKALLISYTLHNESTETVYLLDHMLVGGGGGAYRDAPKVVIVQDGPKPGAVSLVRGFVRSVQDVTINFVPASRALAPGETLTGQAEVALPLTAWHPNGDSPPLSGTPTQAVLEIGYLRGTPSWSHPPIDTGEKLVVPTFSYTVQHQEFVHGAAKPLPAS